MILQTDNRFPNTIRKYGCYFFCLLYNAVKETGLQLDIGVIMQLYNKAIDIDAMTNTCYIKNATALCQVVLKLDARYTGVHAPPNTQINPGQFSIECWERPRGVDSVWRHFVTSGYDPMGRARTVMEGKLVSLRIFDVKHNETIDHAA